MTAEDFKKEVLKWSKILGIKPKEIHIRPMKRKLASCSSRGRLSFSTDFLLPPYEEQANAIVHELLHLKYTNHEKMFKRLLKY